MDWQIRDDAPIYSQLVAQIKLGIAAGTLSPGERLASVRDLAAEAGVPIETIAMQLGHSSIDVAYEHYMRRTKTIMQGAQRIFTKHLFKFA